MSSRRYVPATLPGLARTWGSASPDTTGAVVAEDSSEQAEYDALMTAADASAALLAGLPDGSRRRVVVVVAEDAPDEPGWSDVVAVHVDSHDDAQPDDELGWWATQEIGTLVAGL